MRLRIALALLLSVCASCPTAQANTITVDNASSGSVVGACTIQDAVAAANTNAAVNGCAAGSAGSDTIVFAPGITNITLSAPMAPPAGAATPSACTFGLAINEDLIINGGATANSGTPKVTIARDSVAATPHFGLIGASNDSCAKPALSALPQLTLSGLRLTNGYNDHRGGGVEAGYLTINDSMIDNNTSAPSGTGGGIDSSQRLNLFYSTVSANHGDCGAICGQQMAIGNSTISGNATEGIGDQGASNLVIVNSTVSGNAGNGIIVDEINAYFTTITANKYAGVHLLLDNSTVGLGADFRDSVVAGNNTVGTTSTADLYTSAARPITGQYNWIGTTSSVAHSDLAAGVVIASCPTLNLGPLANNGGGTQTHALLAGSCLIDKGGTSFPSNTFFIASNTDQRGYARFVNMNADIGAFEYQGGETPVNGACGSDNVQTLLATPVNLCSAGTASAVIGSGHPWSWTCVGSGGGSNASCNATIRTWTVSATVSGSGGSVAPPAQVVDNGATASVTATAASGYSLASANGCGSGTLTGTTYTSAAVTADCQISVVFTAAPQATVVLTSSSNPAQADQSIVLTATVTGNGATPTGIVTFFDGVSTLGSVAIGMPMRAGATPSAVLNAAGAATLTTASLSIGSHAISASYSGNATYAAATSNVLSEIVNAPPPTAAPVGAPALSTWALISLGGILIGIGLRARRSG